MWTTVMFNLTQRCVLYFLVFRYIPLPKFFHFISNIFYTKAALAAKPIVVVCRHADAVDAVLVAAFWARHRDYLSRLDLNVILRYLFNLCHNLSPYLQVLSSA